MSKSCIPQAAFVPHIVLPHQALHQKLQQPLRSTNKVRPCLVSDHFQSAGSVHIIPPLMLLLQELASPQRFLEAPTTTSRFVPCRPGSLKFTFCNKLLLSSSGADHDQPFLLGHVDQMTHALHIICTISVYPGGCSQSMSMLCLNLPCILRP